MRGRLAVVMDSVVGHAVPRRCAQATAMEQANAAHSVGGSTTTSIAHAILSVTAGQNAVRAAVLGEGTGVVAIAVGQGAGAHRAGAEQRAFVES